MDRHLGVIRLGLGAAAVGSPGLPTIGDVLKAVGACLHDILGVETYSVDPVGQTVAVRFDRTRISMPDLVRLLEDVGLPVAGVSQLRAVDLIADPVAPAANAEI